MEGKKYPAGIDLAVLILFFCRDEQLSQVFEAVKQARPSRLYLCQDGPRAGRADDAAGIARCREIVSDENIDWECQVHRWYREENMGCDPSGFFAQKWLFAHEEMGVVLEDDIVPAQAFFPFCKELLERYRDEPRVHMICGMNLEGVNRHTEDSYFFTRRGSIWGWASWRRVLDSWDGKYTWMDDPKQIETIRRHTNDWEFENLMRMAEQHRATGKEHFESINLASIYLSNGLELVPKYNLTKNVGISQETTHAVSDLRLLPKRIQRMFYKQTYEIEFPLKHPERITRDLAFEKRVTPTPAQERWDKLERGLRALRYQGVGEALRLVKKNLRGR